MRVVLRTALASTAIALLSCSGVRPAKRPAGNELRTDCPRAPPAELRVGHLRVCRWNRGEMADVNVRVCRAGGNAIMTELTVTDSCVEETLDGMSGTGMTLYEVYRLPP
jgi:hypothetical protein